MKARQLFEGVSPKALWARWAIYMSSGWILASLITAHFVYDVFVHQFGLGYPGYYVLQDIVFGVAIGGAQWLAAWRPYFKKGHWIGAMAAVEEATAAGLVVDNDLHGRMAHCYSLLGRALLPGAGASSIWFLL